MLREEGTVVQDSAAIIDHLDMKYPIPSLTPADPKAAREANRYSNPKHQHIN
jgi:glutathione S-transferase